MEDLGEFLISKIMSYVGTTDLNAMKNVNKITRSTSRNKKPLMIKSYYLPMLKGYELHRKDLNIPLIRHTIRWIIEHTHLTSAKTKIIDNIVNCEVNIVNQLDHIESNAKIPPTTEERQYFIQCIQMQLIDTHSELHKTSEQVKKYTTSSTLLSTWDRAIYEYVHTTEFNQKLSLYIIILYNQSPIFERMTNIHRHMFPEIKRKEDKEDNIYLHWLRERMYLIPSDFADVKYETKWPPILPNYYRESLSLARNTYFHTPT